jgi:cytochrome P450
VRLESLIQHFSRYVVHDIDVDGTTLPQGARAIVLFASANRDQRKWDAPDTFDIMRPNTALHVGFGFGEHACVGSHLARMEIRALLLALAKRVKRFELHKTGRIANNILRGLSKCEVTVH